MKHVDIIPRTLCLFWDANSLPWAKLNRKCPRRNKRAHFCWRLLRLLSFKCLFQLVGKCLWTVWEVYFSVFSGTTLWTNKCIPSSVTVLNALSSSVKFSTRGVFVLDAMFQNRRISLGVHPWKFSSYSLGHIRSRDALRPNSRMS